MSSQPSLREQKLDEQYIVCASALLAAVPRSSGIVQGVPQAALTIVHAQAVLINVKSLLENTHGYGNGVVVQENLHNDVDMRLSKLCPQTQS